VATKEIGEKDSLVINELQDIKRLLVAILIRSGASQGEVALALNVNQSSISRMFPKGTKSKSGSSRKQK
jgi:predicted transcriptional regulator